MEWINIEVQFPDCDRILCYGDGRVFICELIESKWGHFYHSTDWGHGEFQNQPEWTHWMPLPAPPSPIEIGPFDPGPFIADKSKSYFIHLRCQECKNLDIVDSKKGKIWKCPYCEFKTVASPSSTPPSS